MLNIKWIDFVIKSRRVIHLIKYELYAAVHNGQHLDGRECTYIYIYMVYMYLCACMSVSVYISDNLETAYVIRITKNRSPVNIFPKSMRSKRAHKYCAYKQISLFFMLIDYVLYTHPFRCGFFTVILQCTLSFVELLFEEVKQLQKSVYTIYWPPKTF